MLKNWDRMYYAALIFTLIPIVTSYQEGNYIVGVLTTVVFIIAYLTTLHTSNKLLSYFTWLIMGSYILYWSYDHLGMSMFLMFQINLLTFHFNKYSYRSFYWLMVYIEVLILYGTVIYSGIPVDGLIQMMIITIFMFLSHIILKNNMRRIEAEKMLAERNRSLNLLWADNERQRISQDLHDTLGHVFVMLTIKSELVMTLLDNQHYDKAKKELEDLRYIAQKSMKEVREIIHNMKELTLDEELVIIQQMLTLVDIKFTLIQAYERHQLSVAEQATLSMILRELVNNLLKHSEASECRLEISQRQHEIILLFEDNGRGFDKITETELLNIHQRLAKHHGQVMITSRVNPTQIEIRMPMEGI